MQTSNLVSRRRFLRQSLAAALGTISVSASGSVDHGVIRPPRSLPEFTVLRHDGLTSTLHSIAAGHATALQLMFTECMTTCPTQGATFQRVQSLLTNMEKKTIQLISLSIDPAHDTALALSAWLGMFHGGPAWIGAAPNLKDIAEIKSYFGAGSNLLDPHSTETHILNRDGGLVFGTGELAPPEQIAAILRQI